MADHLSKLPEGVANFKDLIIADLFPYEQLLFVLNTVPPLYPDIVSFLVSGVISADLNAQ